MLASGERRPSRWSARSRSSTIKTAWAGKETGSANGARRQPHRLFLAACAVPPFKPHIDR
jgi:hypothetical protein